MNYRQLVGLLAAIYDEREAGSIVKMLLASFLACLFPQRLLLGIICGFKVCNNRRGIEALGF